MALPINVFCISFVVSSVVRRRFIVFTSWFWSLVLALGTLYLGVIAEEWWWHEVNGYFSLPMLLFGSVIILKLGHGLYRHKEVGDYGAPVNLPSGFLGWVIMWLVALILLVLMAGSLLKKFPQFFNT
jgi:hypothetical protein